MESYFMKRQKFLASKWGIEKLTMVGEEDKAKTVQAIIDSRERQAEKDAKNGLLSFGSHPSRGLGLVVRFRL
jgi:hypothetical protein